jgi:hypothetical protein
MTALKHNLKNVLCIGGNRHGQMAEVDWPVYSNTGGFGTRRLTVDGEAYAIETFFLIDGSHWSFLKSPTIQTRDAVAQLFAMAGKLNGQ